MDADRVFERYRELQSYVGWTDEDAERVRDVFRTAVLEKQGWRLQRLWTPHFFRDPRGAVKSVLREMNEPASSPGATPKHPAVAKPAGKL